MNDRAKLCWLCLLCVAATLPPIPKLPHKSAAVHQGAGAKALIAPMPPPAVPVTNTFLWQYPAAINPSNFWWNIEASTDLRTWSVAVSNASGVNTVIVNKNEPVRTFRLSGRMNP